MFDRMDELIGARGWSRSEFLRRVGLNPSAMRDWRLGKSSPQKHLPRIAEVLETTVEYLEGRARSPDPKEIPPDDPAAIEGRRLLREMGIQRPDGSVDYDKLKRLNEFIQINKHIVLGDDD